MTRGTKILAALCGLFATAAVLAHEYAHGSLTIRHPWSRPTVEGMAMGVAYFEIVNAGKAADTLLAASSPVAASVEFHRTVMEDGMARMRPAGALVIAPGATLRAEPEGLHLMLVGLKKPLVAGTQVPLELTFQSAGRITVQLKIEQPSGDGHGRH